jgi:uncharacterized protein (DUF488 family)
MIRLYTIGFTEKSAERFFQLLEQNQVKKIIDTRVSNNSQLSGFAKGKDLAFFAKQLANIDYEHQLKFAPSKELLGGYRKKAISWNEYAKEYIGLLDERNISVAVNTESLHECCLLCSEHTAEKCHRRLLAEYLQNLNSDIEIIHLQ